MPARHDVEGALAALGEMLAADGYRLRVEQDMAEVVVAQIDAGPDACADCLVPKEMMRGYFEAALRKAFAEPPALRLVYPGEG
jgi:hypothetical protein